MDDKLDAFLDGLSRYASCLPADDEHPLEILILRGHLLIEEELRQLVALKFIKWASPEFPDTTLSIL